MSRETNKILDEILFLGGLNSDDDPRMMPKGDYLDAVNVRANEDGNGGVVVNVKGNESVYSLGTPPTSEGYLCGWTYCKRNETVILFIYQFWNVGNPNRSLIVEYDPETDTATALVDDSDNSLLNFSNPSTSSYFIDAKNAGEWLAWTDNINPPRMINIEDVKAPASVTVNEAYLDLHKIRPTAKSTGRHIPPLVTLGYDSTKKYNNLNTGYQFKYRFGYNDFRYSTWSPSSDLAINESLVRVEDGYNLLGTENYIDVQFNSGDSNVSFVDIAVREGNTGNWFKISKIDKSNPENIYSTGGVLQTTALSDNTDYDYRFFNNEGRIAISNLEASKPYDYVPDRCESVTFIGDNRLLTGGVVEGKDVDVELDVSLSSVDTTVKTFFNWSGTESIGIDGTNRGYLQIDFDWDDIGNTNALAGDYVHFDFAGTGTHSSGSNLIYSLDEVVVFTDRQIGISDILTYLRDNTSTPTNSGTPPTGSWAITVESGNILRFRWTSAATVTSFSTSSYNTDASTVANSGYVLRDEYVNELGFSDGITHKLALIYEDKYGKKWPALTSSGTEIEIEPIPSGTDSKHRAIQYTINNVCPDDAVGYRWAYAYKPKIFTEVVITDESYYEDTNGVLQVGSIALDISGNNQFITNDYSIAVGDYIKIIREGGSYSSLGDYVDDSLIFIIDDIRATINDGVDDLAGTWLIVKPANATGYDYDSIDNQSTGTPSKFTNALIRIYRETSEDQDYAYYEIGSGGYCEGGTVNHYDWFTNTNVGYINQGDVWYRPQPRYVRNSSTKSDVVSNVLYIQSPLPYKNAPRADVGIADINVEFPESEKKYFNTIRWSNNFIEDTKLNGLSSFDSSNKIDVSENHGKIKGLEELGASLVVICEKKVLSSFVGATEYTDTQGNIQVVKSTKPLSYLRAHSDDYGTFLKESILNTGEYIYFFDLYNMSVVRKASNGLFPISGKSITPTGERNYKMRTYFTQLSKKLISSLSSGNIYDVKVYMGYDKYYHDVYITFEDKNVAANNVSLIFDETRSRWVSRYDSYINSKTSRMMPFTRSNMMSYYDNDLYILNSDNVNRCNLYGDNRQFSIKYRTFEMSNLMKLYNYIRIHSNKKWDISADDAIITLDNDSYSIMSSKIPSGSWVLEEGVYGSNFFRNAKSTSDSIKLIDLYVGEELRGYTLIIEMTNDSTELVRLFKVEIQSEMSG